MNESIKPSKKTVYTKGGKTYQIREYPKGSGVQTSIAEGYKKRKNSKKWHWKEAIPAMGSMGGGQAAYNEAQAAMVKSVKRYGKRTLEHSVRETN